MADSLSYSSPVVSLPPPPRRALHVATLATAVLAFPLVWMGGLVTTHGAGMSVPDWPNSYGYNMFALPFGMWLGKTAGGAFYEHTHRLLGTLVGLAAFAATMLAWAPSASREWRTIYKWTTLISTAWFVLTLVIAWVLRHQARISDEQYKVLTHAFSGAGALAVTAGICWSTRGPHEPARWRRWLVTAVLAIVCVQGLMGGLRVDENSLTLAKIHGILGQLTFAFAGVAAATCSRWWATVGAVAAPARRLRRLAVTALALAIVQLSLGAFMRHDPHRIANSPNDGSAGLAIPDWPLHYGEILPPMTDAALKQVNDHRVWIEHMAPVTMGRIWLHFSHRMGAYVTAAVLLWLAVHVMRRYRDERAILVPGVLLGVLVIVQVTLGVLTVLWRKPADIATLHQATGALIVSTAAVMVARIWRRFPSQRLVTPQPSPAVASTLQAQPI